VDYIAHEEAVRRAIEVNLLERLCWRIGEWCLLTGTSRPTTWRKVKAGTLKIVYYGTTPMVPRSEAVRLGFIKV
jgi:hypothetical protein